MVKLKLPLGAALVGMLILSNSAIVNAQNFGGPDAVENRIADDAQPKQAFIQDRVLQPWFDWKQNVQEDHGFSIGLDYRADA
jgi:hypothetical protein